MRVGVLMRVVRVRWLAGPSLLFDRHKLVKLALLLRSKMLSARGICKKNK
jgi:hypothetical protein